MARWILPSYSNSNLASIWGNLPSPLVRVMDRRGFDEESLDRYLNPRLAHLSDPSLLPDMEQAVEVCLMALDNKMKVVVFGDYDVDGATSSALLQNFFKAFSVPITAFVPLRLEEGYGLNRESVTRCYHEHSPDLLVAVDCGTTAVEEIQWLKEKGVEVVVLDHHEPGPVRPPCRALVNPKYGNSHHYLASVGVVFKLIHALIRRLKSRGEVADKALPDLKSWLDLVAVGTVADLVPLIEENRIFVKFGLQQLAVTTSPGLKALLEVGGITAPYQTHHIGFGIGPRLNASGRMESAVASLEILTTQDVKRAHFLAQQLDEMNRWRQDVEKSTYEQAVTQVGELYPHGDMYSLVLGAEGWHPGVIGIVAARLVRDYYRPTFIVGWESGQSAKGSGRSITGMNLFEALKECAPYLEKFGGHAMAAGITVKPDRLIDFRSAFEGHVRKKLGPEDLEQVLELDAPLEMSEINEEFMEALALLEPHGQMNPDPLFYMPHLRLASPAQRVGKGFVHLKLVVTDGMRKMDAILFGWGDRPLPGKGEVELACKPVWNEFNGRRQIQLKVRDLRMSHG